MMIQRPPPQRPKKSAINGNEYLVGRAALSSPEPEPEEVFEKSDDTLPTGEDPAETALGIQENVDEDRGLLLLCRQLSDYTDEVRRTFKGLTDRLNHLEVMVGWELSRQWQLEALIRQQPMATASANSTILRNPVTDALRAAADFRQPNAKLTEERFRKKLVICCEGNAGFAEIGVIGAPLQNGYSILAWNHPGFGGSEGLPYPDQEQDAMEAVLLFATHQLKFQRENIRVFGWSIGGYTATWAAAHMPQIGGLILDATFDMLDELARNALPFLGESITVGLVHSYFDLNVAAQIAQYPGPILILRRSHDEVITTTGPESNRGNYLIVKLLKYRFPFLFTEESEQRLWQFILLGAAQQEEFLATKNITDDLMEPILKRELSKLSSGSEDKAAPAFPSNIGSSGISEAQKIQILLYLASKYFKEVFGTHCTPLDPVNFVEPWSESRLLTTSTR